MTTMWRKLFVSACLSALMLIACPMGSAFTVIKNVNSNTPPVVKAILFEKGKGADQLAIHSTASCQTAINSDGAIESHIVGHDEVKITFQWKPHDELKDTFDCSKYGYLLLTCRLEGTNHVAAAGGKTIDQRPDNLWFPVQLFNPAGEQVASANLADVTEDHKTPAQTVELRIPMSVLTYYGHDASQIASAGFTWDKAKPGTERDFRLIVDKIALAD